MSTPSLYVVLGITPDAGSAEIRRAHRVLARTLHPDVNKDVDAAKGFALVQSAYETLSDPERRAAYDRGLQRGEVWHPTPADLRPHDAWADLAREEFEEDVEEVWRTFFVPREQSRARAGTNG
ncbi:MAG: J domain-containing protein [Phycisphaerales bacterium]|nr:J domain-containing protein [Phycisphaerales bacterium]